MEKRVILASQSPRRHALIKKVVSDFDIILPNFDEQLDTDIYTDEMIKNFSYQKALSVLNDNNLENSLIVSADTMVVLDNKIYGKPKDIDDAICMLKELSGKTHFVVTSVTVLDTDTKVAQSDVVKTYVTFQNLTDDLILNYVKERNPIDKAGAYGIQEMGIEFIKSVDGDLENVIGLPTKKLKELINFYLV